MATTEIAHWTGPALLPHTFEASWTETLRFGQLEAAIQLNDGETIFAVVRGTNATNDATIQIRFYGATATWTMRGPGPQSASGTMEYR